MKINASFFVRSYVFHATGAMKAFLDHCGYRWMSHRPEAAMFKKQGVAKRYQYGVAVAATDWNGVSEKKMNAIEKATSKIAKRIHSFVQNTNEIYETVMQVAGSDVMKEKAMEMKQAIDCQMTWESIIKRIEDLV